MASSVKIAVGANNVAGLKSLELLSPPLFKDYIFPEGVSTEFHPYVARELDGNRVMVKIGRPWVAWKLYRLTRAEMNYLLATFGDPVTIRTLDKETNTYRNYNATFNRPDLVEQVKWDTNTWDDVRIEFWDLVEI